jgi:hypothetical protein
MRCPEEVAEILCDILATGLVRIRAAALSGDAERCQIESDHLHNLPRLLSDYTDEALAYYWEAERPSFVDRSAGASTEDFDGPWGRLKKRLTRRAIRA